MVRVRYSFGSRHTGRIANIKKQRQKYPDVMRKVIEISDIVLEILDARYIEETRNLEVEEKIDAAGKKLIFVFNKCDLVDREELEKQIPKWMRPYVFVSATKGIGLGDLKARIKMEAKRILAARKSTRVSVGEGDVIKEKMIGKSGKVTGSADEATWKRIHVGVIGFPNAGKSSVINFVARRSAAPTGAKAGFTKGVQNIRMSEGILILDTPGVIPESRYTSETKGFAEDVKVGARSYSDVRDPERALSYLVVGRSVVGGRWSVVEGEAQGVDAKVDEELVEKQRLVDAEALKNAVAISKFYGIGFMDEKGANVEVLIEKLGRKKGFLVKGGVVDEDRTARLILRDWQEGRIRVK